MAAREKWQRPTLNEVEKYIGLLRAANAQPRPASEFRPAPDFDIQPRRKSA